MFSQTVFSLTRLVGSTSRPVCLVISRSYKHFPETISTNDVFMPEKIEDRLLSPVPHTPTRYPEGVVGPLKHPRAPFDMQGPERIHNQLIYRKFGVIALSGGSLQGAHFDMISNRINKYLDTERFFAVWRVDPPWKAVSRKSLGKRMGGGKAKVHHFETPVRAGRIIVEVAGIGVFDEVSRILDFISERLPFYSIPITQEKMDALVEEKKKLDAENYNPFEYRYLLRNNFSDSQRFISPREILWGGTYF